MLLTELDLPSYDHIDPTVTGAAFHAALDDLASETWIAKGFMGYAVLEREAANAVLRDRRMAFPALELLELQGVTSGPIWDRTADGLMVQSGEPHSRLRRQLAPAFTPRATERLRPRLRELIAELWEPVADTGHVEFVKTVAEPLPSMAIAELLGVQGDAPLLARWSVQLQEVFKMRLQETAAEVETAYEEARAYVFEKLAERRKEPGDDLISVLAAGTELDDDDYVTLICSVISGGTDTTEAQLAHGLRLFAQHPEQWALLAEQPELAEKAVEEVVRYEPITPFTARIATEDVVLRDVVIPKDTVLFVCAATANRDPATFKDPQRFDITREPEPVLTFGFGAHYCIGAYLARAELQEAFTYLAPRTPDLHLDGEPVFGQTTGIYAMQSLPLAWSVR
ncbi:MAG: cytochrome P450 [Frankiaceae bacterium]|nr:cytochrome P450 [Frankiaceae bacterium]